MRYLQTAVIGAVLALLPLSSHALLFNGEVGVAAWNQSLSGTAQSNGGEEVNVDNDLGLDGDVNGFVWAAFEPRLLPNVRLRYTPMSFDGKENRTFQLLDQNWDGDVETDVTLDQADVTVYFTPLNNVVTLGLGLNVKLISGHFEMTGEAQAAPGVTQSERVSLDVPLPMLYAHAGLSLPFTGLSGKVEAMGISYDDNRLIDVTAGVRYRLMPLINLELGYRYQDIQVEEDDLEVDLKVDGLYLGVLARF